VLWFCVIGVIKKGGQWPPFFIAEFISVYLITTFAVLPVASFAR